LSPSRSRHRSQVVEPQVRDRSPSYDGLARALNSVPRYRPIHNTNLSVADSVCCCRIVESVEEENWLRRKREGFLCNDRICMRSLHITPSSDPELWVPWRGIFCGYSTHANGPSYWCSGKIKKQQSSPSNLAGGSPSTPSQEAKSTILRQWRLRQRRCSLQAAELRVRLLALVFFTLRFLQS
jgi:hypothetical protein